MSLLDINYWDGRMLMALLNLALTSAIGWACVCRISVMSASTTRPLTRAAYVLLIGAASVSGFSPALLREWPGWADILINAAVLLHLSATVRAWRAGVPPFAKSGPVPLDDHHHAAEAAGDSP